MKGVLFPSPLPWRDQYHNFYHQVWGVGDDIAEIAVAHDPCQRSPEEGGTFNAPARTHTQAQQTHAQAQG